MASAEPEAVFCTFIKETHKEQITFGQLFHRSAAYAHRYLQMGVKRGDVVIVILQHTPHLFYSYLGAILAGGIPSFMPFPTPKQRPELYWADHAALFGRIKPRLIVTYEQNLSDARKALAHFEIPALIADDEIFGTFETKEALAFDLPGFSADPDDVACLQHSSGTTSLKKGVMLTHRAILGQVEAYAKALDFGEKDSIASWLPLYHDMGFIACFMASVLLGTHVVALDPFEWVMRPSILLDAIARYRTTFCWLPNFAFSHIATTARADARWDLSSVRAFINCSEPCKPETFERFAARFARDGISMKHLQVCYAMAENVFAVTQTQLGSPPRIVRADAQAFSRGTVETGSVDAATIAVLSCGTPIQGVHIEIPGAEGVLPADGRIGEIFLTGPFLFSGYYELPEKTQAKMHGEWYASGDMGFVLDGELYVTGRADDMIIVNGQNFYAHEIEAAVSAIPATIPGRNVAFGVYDERADAMTVVVLAECRSGAHDQAGQEVRQQVLGQLGLAIHTFLPVERGQLVKTTSGKISRGKNKELYVNGGFARQNV